MSTDHLISTKQVSEESGATYRQLTYWMQLDVIPHDLLPRRGRGSGNHARWSPKAIPVMYVLHRLQTDGIRIDVRLLGYVATTLTRLAPADWPDWLPIPGAPHLAVAARRLLADYGTAHPESFAALLPGAA